MKPVYDRYKSSNDKETFLREFESEIIVSEAAAREIKNFRMYQIFCRKDESEVVRPYRSQNCPPNGTSEDLAEGKEV